MNAPLSTTQSDGTAVARLIPYAVSILSVIVIWELLGRFVINNDLVFAPLSHVFVRAFEMAESGELWRHVRASGIAFLIGYSASVIFGVMLGFLVATRPRFAFYVEPWLSALYATPMIALAPIFVVLLGIGLSSKIAIIFIEAFFPVTANAALGIRSTNRELIEALFQPLATGRRA